jgi:hypothetical protein
MSTNPTVQRGLVLLWADAQGYTDFVQPWIHKGGVIRDWKDSRPQPDDATLRAAGTDDEARARVREADDEEIADRKVSTDVYYKVLALMYAELAPLTNAAARRRNLKKWIRQARG